MVEDAPRSPASDIAAAVATVVRRLRNDEGWTLDDLSARAGMHRTSLGLIERGERGMTIASAEAVAAALDMPLSGLIALAENEQSGVPESLAPRRPRRAPQASIRDGDALEALCGLDETALRQAIDYAYDTLDLIDAELIGRKSEPVAGLVELANLASMLGNLLGAGLAVASDGKYVRNRPHAFPDLLPQTEGLPHLELKTALETNKPKGHLPKPGGYITFRYSLGHADGTYRRGKEHRGKTVWVWEVRAGHLDATDFDISNTEGDSGKTANIRTDSLKAMSLVYQDDRFNPYARPWGQRTSRPR